MAKRRSVEHVQDRTYAQRYHRQNQKAVFWRHHLDCWSQTSLTQIAYCENNGLSPTSFARWKALLTPKTAKRRPRDAKILVDRPYYDAKEKCSYCGGLKMPGSMLFIGPDETVSICSDCVFQKYREFLTKNESQCVMCRMEDPRSAKSQNIHVLRDHLRLCAPCILSIAELAQKYFAPLMTCNFCNFPMSEMTTQRVGLWSGVFRVCGQCIDLLFLQKQVNLGARTCVICRAREVDDRKLVRYLDSAVHVCETCVGLLARSIAK